MDHPARTFHVYGMGMWKPGRTSPFLGLVINQALTVGPGYLRVSRTDRERAI